MRRGIRRIAAAGAVALLAGFNLPTQFRYLAETTQTDNPAMIERLTALRTLDPGRPVLLDITDPIFPGFVAAYTRGHPTVVLAGSRSLGVEGFLDALDPRARDPGAVGTIVASLENRGFPLGSGASGALEFRQVTLRGVSLEQAALIAPTADHSVINGSTRRPATGRYYVRNLADVRNHLALIDSTRGHVVLPGVIENVALWQRERDFADPNGGIQAIGRYLLFQVLNPVTGSRLLLDITTSPLAGFGWSLPPAAVVGQQRVELGLVGRGAARVLSAPLVPHVIDGRSYIAIDMGVDVTRFRDARTGLTGLFNPELGLDPRTLVAFARNISLLAPDQEAALAPPSRLAGFPAGLLVPGLLFSGVYEDGWMAEAARFRLKLAAGSRGVRVAGHLPGIGALQQGAGIALLVDGEPVLQRRIAPGDFTVQAELPRSGEARWIEIRLDTTDRLGGADGRVASILLRSVELEGPP